MNDSKTIVEEEVTGSVFYMKDSNGLTEDDEDFFRIDGKTWIYEGQPNHLFVGKENHHTEGILYIYRKIANGELIDLVKADSYYIPAMTYKDFRERQTGMKWEDLLKNYEK